MNWKIHLTGPAAKSIKRLPKNYRHLAEKAIDEFAEFPFGGDVQKLGPQSWRRRIASYRIFFDVYFDKKLVVVTAITRRTSSTY